MSKLTARDGLRKEYRRLRPTGVYPNRSLVGRPPAVFLLHEIVALAEKRADRGKRISPAEWKRDLRHPVVRAKLECAEGDRLITVKEACGLLDVRRQRIGELIGEGRLFCWQKKPGRQGSRTWLSERQVMRLMENVEHWRRHVAAKTGKRPNPSDREEPEWVTDAGLRNEEQKFRKPFLERDYGEHFTSAQTARKLGVSRGIVRRLRRRGRLKGFRSERANPRSPQAWWFYRKEDVYGLLEDSDYVNARDRSKAARERGPRPLTEEELYEFIKINAFGRPPRGQIMDTGWSWGDPRIHHISPFMVDPNDPPGGWWDRETWREMLK